MLEECMPLINLDSQFLFEELDSLGVTTILMLLSEKYNVKLDHSDVTPKNFKTLDSLVAMVESKQKK